MYFQNQATLSYNNRVITSNIVSGTIIDPFSITKRASRSTYQQNSEIVYTITVTNSLDRQINGALIYDDMTVTQIPGLSILNSTLPLSIDFASVKLQRVSETGISRIPNSIIPETNGTGFMFIMPARSTIMLSYNAKVNSYANLTPGSSITNTATFTAPSYDPIEAKVTIDAADYSDIRVSKYLYEKQVSSGQPLTYILIVSNYGNATVSPEITDILAPKLNEVMVFGNGLKWTEGVEYTIDPNTDTLNITENNFTVDAATITKDATGKWMLTPTSYEIAITGITL